MSSVSWLSVPVRRVVWALSWVTTVCASVESSARETLLLVVEVERRDDEEPCRGGSTLLRYSAASKVGERKACRKGSEVWADLGSILAGGVVEAPPGRAALDAARLWRESPRWRVVAAELFCRRRERGVDIIVVPLRPVMRKRKWNASCM